METLHVCRPGGKNVWSFVGPLVQPGDADSVTQLKEKKAQAFMLIVNAL